MRGCEGCFGRMVRERRTGKHALVRKRLKVEYSLVVSRIVPKATTFIPCLLCLNCTLDLLPSSIVKYCLVGRKPTVHWKLEPTHLTDVHAFGWIVHL